MVDSIKTKNDLLIITSLVIMGFLAAGFCSKPAHLPLIQLDNQQVDKDLTISLGGGGNSGILVTDSVVVVIDTKMGKDAEDLYNLARQTAGPKRIIVINTHYHGDHVKGNHFYAGDRIYIAGYDKAFLEKEVEAANMPDFIVHDSLTLNLGNETIVLYDMGQAHTYHDMIVYLKKRKMLFSGDLIFHDINPVLKRNSGADVEMWIAVLGKIQKKLDIKTLVPGHGKVGGKELLGSMKQYFIDMKIATTNPIKETEARAKYKDWMEMPGMASVSATIDYIRGK